MNQSDRVLSAIDSNRTHTLFAEDTEISIGIDCYRLSSYGLTTPGVRF